MRRERVDLSLAPMIVRMASYTTDGTANLQTMLDWALSAHGNPRENAVWVEPEQARTRTGDTNQPLDYYSRAIIFAQRSVGSGSWDGEWKFRREGQAEETVIPFKFQAATGANPPAPQIIDTPFPADFCREAALVSPTMGDLLEDALTVTPFGAVAADLVFTGFIIAGHRDAISNKGAVLSHRKYLGGARG